MSEPAFEFGEVEAPPPPSKRIGGWIALWTILALLCANSLWSYFSQDPRAESRYFQVSTGFRTWVLQTEASKRFPILRGANADSVKESLGDSLDDLIAQVVDSRKKSSNAARLYVAMRYEKGTPIRKEDLAFLEGSKEAWDRGFAKVYTTEKLSRPEAERLVATFPDQGFSFTMARIHALEKAGDKGARQRFLPDSEIVQPTIALAVLGGSMFLGMAFLALYFSMRIAGSFKPLGHPAGKLDTVRADAFAGTAALMLFAYLAISIGVQLALGRLLPGETSSIVSGVLTIVATLFLLTKGRSLHGPGASIYGFDRSRLFKDVLWGVGGFFAGVPLFMSCACVSQYLFSGLPDPGHPITFEIQANQSLPMLILVLGLASVIAPIFEETCFRGLITPATDSLFGGPFMGIVASSLAFAMIHPQGISGWLPLAMIGGTAAMLTYQRKSLVPAIVYHAVHNCFVLTMTVLML